METKYITIPFDVQRAKRISNGEEEGKIVTRDGRNVRIVCWDAKSDDLIIALVEDKNGVECPYSYLNNGSYHIGERNDIDIMLSVPECTNFKDGDVLYVRTIKSGWYVFIYNDNGGDKTSCYFALDYDGKLWAYSNRVTSNDDISELRFATEEERKKLIDTLKASNIKIAKIYLKYFFGIEKKKECDFKPFDKVLVRDDNNKTWIPGFFWSKGELLYGIIGGTYWEQCIPYEGNEHLLGTSNDPE